MVSGACGRDSFYLIMTRHRERGRRGRGREMRHPHLLQISKVPIKVTFEIHSHKCTPIQLRTQKYHSMRKKISGCPEICNTAGAPEQY